jgi:hypothetical protein
MTESGLDNILLDRLEQFLSGSGRGWCFLARHPRNPPGEEAECLDLLFFHRELRCLVAVDLKLGDLLPEHVRQMHSHLGHLSQYLAHPHENVPIGIVLCTGRESEVVRFVIPSDDAHFVTHCQRALPCATDLRQWLREQRERVGQSAALQYRKLIEPVGTEQVRVAAETAIR